MKPVETALTRLCFFSFVAGWLGMVACHLVLSLLYENLNAPPSNHYLPLLRMPLPRSLDTTGTDGAVWEVPHRFYTGCHEQLVRSGRLKYRESIAEGLENAPKAFIGLLAGRNFGKQLVRLV